MLAKRISILLASAVLPATILFGQATEPVYRVGGGVTAPHPVYTPSPEYSDQARKSKYQGTVVLWMVIGSDGCPRDIKVARSLGMGLDEKAIEAVRAWRFEPARKYGQPVAVQINVETSFRLHDPQLPAQMAPPGSNGTDPPQSPDTDAESYPLAVDIRFVTGQLPSKGYKGYLVNAEATIHEGDQHREAAIFCGPKGKCFMLGSGEYPARWLNGNDRMELLGRDDNGKWHKVQFSVGSMRSSGD